jgi:REP element-mobilizing transposase RayT
VCVFAEDDYCFYVDTLRALARRFGCPLHAYVLMTNHVHLLLAPQRADTAALLMKSLKQRYVQYVNRTSLQRNAVGGPLSLLSDIGGLAITPTRWAERTS